MLALSPLTLGGALLIMLLLLVVVGTSLLVSRRLSVVVGATPLLGNSLVVFDLLSVALSRVTHLARRGYRILGGLEVFARVVIQRRLWRGAVLTSSSRHLAQKFRGFGR